MCLILFIFPTAIQSPLLKVTAFEMYKLHPYTTTVKQFFVMVPLFTFIVLTKTTAAQNEVALRYYRVRRLYLLAVVFVTTIYSTNNTSTRVLL